MALKMAYRKAIQSLELATGEFDSSVTLTAPTKGKLVQSSGDFQGYDFDEGADILYGQSGTTPSDGVWVSPYGQYIQSNISVDPREFTSKDGNRFGFVIYRAPNISNSSTWGGVNLSPSDALQRIVGHKYRLSFDYRGYSGGYPLYIYQSYSSGWGSWGMDLPVPWSTSISAFDTDWEWRHFEYEFAVTSQYANWVPGSNSLVWNSTTQYPAGYYAIVYNGYAYGVNNTAPTLGVNPETEWASNNGKYRAKWPQTAGYANLYAQLKIGFEYEAQNARGTHVHVDNIQLTDITNNTSFKYNLSTSTWVADNLLEPGLDILAKGTAYVSQPRTDTSTDIFAVEGNQKLVINSTNVYDTGGRGLRLTVFNSAGTVISDATYDTYGTGTACDNLATALSGVTSNQYWSLTSFDAIGDVGRHNANPNLRNKMISMGSRLWNPNEGNLYLWYYSSGDARIPYAAVGKGQNIIREDGAGASDTKYKRKGVIQTRIS